MKPHTIFNYTITHTSGHPAITAIQTGLTSDS